MLFKQFTAEAKAGELAEEILGTPLVRKVLQNAYKDHINSYLVIGNMIVTDLHKLDLDDPMRDGCDYEIEVEYNRFGHRAIYGVNSQTGRVVLFAN